MPERCFAPGSHLQDVDLGRSHILPAVIRQDHRGIQLGQDSEVLGDQLRVPVRQGRSPLAGYPEVLRPTIV
eukprot:6676699-Heterocapsa_arctica.AAC.1